ncbi:hypothetical protein BDF21DRAFT_447699 [Thamnidium elegans]|uniref:Arrestin C-terminal-like domain-containing protein n=1 Tax=Thamnidium elegans TaxID=101142 RepID=A0A8H7VRQ0_9FUNG|nr:hypothetical protein INT48_004461 [Thamnidium elegans]KAI8095444.1 hypothetical protein BDF21DRAFT_447699 [Thamnidium elegans]
MSLTINLLPEFGWSIKNQPVYGPGSAFQGFVKINVTELQLQKADRLRIVFHATESTCDSGYISPTYHNQLFGSQKVLWNHKTSQLLPLLRSNTDISIPFIVQLPMIQFPPSSRVLSESEGLGYSCSYTLSAYLDSQTQGEAAIIKVHKPIIYMPFIETGFSKKPICITTFEKGSNLLSSSEKNSKPGKASPTAPSVNVKLASLDYVPGDIIPVSLLIKGIPKHSIESVSIRLYQNRTWNKTTNNLKSKTNKGERKVSHLITQENINLNLIDTNNSSSSSSIESKVIPIDSKLEISIDNIPSFSYSPVFSIGYQLKINIKRKGKIWNSNFDLTDIPINIGTLGYGIRSSEEIKVYSTFQSVFDQPPEGSNADILPAPKFLNFLEYEEALPLYNEDRLPKYESSLNTPHHQYMSCIM